MPTKRDLRLVESDPSPLEPLKEYAAELDEMRVRSLRLMKIADDADLPALHLEAAGIRERVERAQVELTSWADPEAMAPSPIDPPSQVEPGTADAWRRLGR